MLGYAKVCINLNIFHSFNKFKCPRRSNTWAEYEFKSPMNCVEIVVYPRIDFGLDRDSIVKVKFQFLGHEIVYNSRENSEDISRNSRVEENLPNVIKL